MHRPTAAPVVRCAPPALSRRRLRRCAGPTPIAFLLRLAALGVAAAIARPNHAESRKRGGVPDELADRGVTLNGPWGRPHPNLMAVLDRSQVCKDRPPSPINSAIDTADEHVGQAEAF